MVVVGNFSVRIVHAGTKEPFKEHVGPDGKTYAEIEPGADYFIEAEVVGGDPDEVFCWEYTVDGKGLGHYSNLSLSYGKEYEGIWSYQNGISKTRALSFQSPTRASADSLEHTGRGEVSGTVRVDVSEAICEGDNEREDHLPTSMKVASVNAIPGMTDCQRTKVVRSGEGSHCETTTISGNTQTNYNVGELLQSITINYCTVLGLIFTGVLPKPADIWDTHRLYNPLKRSSETTAINVEPKRVKSGGLAVAGFTLRAPTEHDFFDLYDVPDDGDGDSNNDSDGSSNNNSPD